MPPRPSGIPQLDRVLGGGVPSGDLVLVMGAAGTGKTTLALQMAFHAAARGEAACFVSTTSDRPSACWSTPAPSASTTRRRSAGGSS